MGLLEAIILTVIAASTPLLIAACGELVVERAGVLNLGVEGMMIIGAACGFAGAWLTGSTLVGALFGIAAGVGMSLVFAALTLGLAVNQVATGLALTILGVGLSGLIGAGFVGERISAGAEALHPGPDRSAVHRPHPVRAGWLRLCLDRAGRRDLVVPLPDPRRAWCCARSATTTPRRMRSAIRCCASAPLAVLFGGACAGPGRRLSCRSPTRRSSSRA